MPDLPKVFARVFALSGHRLLEVKLWHGRTWARLPFPLQGAGEPVPICGIARLETKSLSLCGMSHRPAKNG